MEGRLRSNHGNQRGRWEHAPPKRPGKAGPTSQVYLIKFYLVVFSLASKYSQPSEVLRVSPFPAGSDEMAAVPFSLDVQPEIKREQ